MIGCLSDNQFPCKYSVPFSLLTKCIMIMMWFNECCISVYTPQHTIQFIKLPNKMSRIEIAKSPFLYLNCMILKPVGRQIGGGLVGDTVFASVVGSRRGGDWIVLYRNCPGTLESWHQLLEPDGKHGRVNSLWPSDTIWWHRSGSTLPDSTKPLQEPVLTNWWH